MEGPAARVLFLRSEAVEEGGTRDARRLADYNKSWLDERPGLWTCSEDGRGEDTADRLPSSWARH